MELIAIALGQQSINGFFGVTAHADLYFLTPHFFLEWDNADFNAAKNIRNRALVTVLRESLLKQLDNGAFEPKKFKREKVKEVLLSFRRNLQETARSECIKGSVTTFDYI